MGGKPGDKTEREGARDVDREGSPRQTRGKATLDDDIEGLAGGRADRGGE